jgi:hypothetical protein
MAVENYWFLINACYYIYLLCYRDKAFCITIFYQNINIKISNIAWIYSIFKYAYLLRNTGYHICRHISGVFLNFTSVGVEESIVNALYRLRIICLNVTFLHEWSVHNRLFNAYYEVKFKKTPDRIMYIAKDTKISLDFQSIHCAL